MLQVAAPSYPKHCIILKYILVFEARWSEMEWMIQKNVNKEGREIPEQEGEFVSSFF